MLCLILIQIYYLECELQKLDPIRAHMPSTYIHFHNVHLSASNCINGIHERDINGLCSTYSHPAPWIALQFSKPVFVQKVVLYNRKDCCGDRARNVQVRVSSALPTNANTMTTDGQLLGSFPGPGTEGQIIDVSSKDTLMGEFVIVQMDLALSPGILNLLEVEAYGFQCTSIWC